MSTKPFLGYASQLGSEFASLRRGRPDAVHEVPVCVTPYAPGDPRLGERWQRLGGSRSVTITGAPFFRNGRLLVPTDGGMCYADCMEPAPELKTFVLPSVGFKVHAESREVALKHIADVLVEV